ncbi:sensor histidine kinase [Christiangramia flava]|uniref:histidine kinase n=1 Tax=Christiangramia flava JLT2011 TaxID=1229726 RepID=A0A1L7I8P9_9FLAO|nr:ATP-binding protein [Christiangramia flava]APU69485.1 Two-component sensor histidine kinase [Christiangramia flava JLT2011]OSS37913.1 sensory transduction histidine kinase [Christiangramia flava JLT2011]
MNSLLKRQLKKYLPAHISEEELMPLLDSISHSYNNYEEQIAMSQRAMRISSDELFDANSKLRNDAEKKEKIIDTFNNCLNMMNVKAAKYGHKEMEVEELADFIETQATQIHQIQSQREELLHTLEQKNEVLSDYAHMVSHDLKSPLRSIDALANWILSDHLKEITPEGQDKFRLLLQNVERMDALIEGVLNYSTIDQAQLETYKVDLGNLLEETLQILYIPESTKVEVITDLPVIQGDRFRLQQLFQNLIHNAVNSMEDGKVGKVEIGHSEDKENFTFFVRDNGKGIPKNQHEKIFKIFEKLENNQTSTGIGLSIVKKIIDFYKGRIWLESTPGLGSTFFFQLPKINQTSHEKTQSCAN